MAAEDWPGNTHTELAAATSTRTKRIRFMILSRIDATVVSNGLSHENKVINRKYNSMIMRNMSTTTSLSEGGHAAFLW
jgi:hypothetical protein